VFVGDYDDSACGTALAAGTAVPPDAAVVIPRDANAKCAFWKKALAAQNAGAAVCNIPNTDGAKLLSMVCDTAKVRGA